jgi:hypothetical protein
MVVIKKRKRPIEREREERRKDLPHVRDVHVLHVCMRIQ